MALYIIPGIIAIIALGLYIGSHYCFDDKDPDMQWHDNYAVSECPHLERTDVVVDSVCTLEEIWEVCDNCGEVLSKRIEW